MPACEQGKFALAFGSQGKLEKYIHEILPWFAKQNTHEQQNLSRKTCQVKTC
jgi:hypothetical protein